VLSHSNVATEECMKKILIYGSTQHDMLRGEYKLLLNDWVLEPQRVARRQPELRGEGEAKDQGKKLAKDLGSKRQAKMFLDQLLVVAHGIEPSEAEGAEERAATQRLKIVRQELSNRLDQLRNAEHVAERLLGHCAGCNSGHGDVHVGRHTELLWHVQWQHYGLKGASWETQHAIEVGSPTPWAPAVRHENSRVLLSYATDNNLALEPINDISTNTTTAKLGLEGYESDEHVQSDKLKRAMNELRALAAQTNHSWLWASVYSGSDSDGEE
jgi:hypothetical protein